MSVELKVPEVGESITEVQIGEWLKSEGDPVAADDPVVVIETDKVTVELPAPSSGVIVRRLKQKGESARVGEVIGYMEAGDGAAAAREIGGTDAETGEAPGTPPRRAGGAPERGHVMPAARRVLAERGLDAAGVRGTGPGGRVTKEDAVRAAAPAEDRAGDARGEAVREAPQARTAPRPAASAPAPGAGAAREEVVPMSPLRRRIAARLVEAQRTAAILTTFNEVDMSAVMALRREHQASFQERYGIKLGIMSFFVKAAVDALRLVPQVNAEIRGDSIVYRDHYDIGVAVGGGKGLVVPVVRNAESLSFAEVEISIADLSARARDNKLALGELQGGTFTISNGGIYGSLLSTPILNPPQSGILGMHAIQERAVVRDGQIVARPMMYVALSYDHRLVDGREAVSFLVRVKECVESPARMLLEA